uniref:Ubinuclein 1 n=1 Tax=Dicentrarchus labrax TaxID=13489 RepID=A0A8C4IE51_DICLA
MAESRRVQLTTLSYDVPASSDEPAAAQRPPSGVPQQVKETRPDRPADPGSVRLVLTLFEPDERSFPEFSYSQLVDNKINHTKVEVPLSRFEEEDKRENDEAAALAKALEEKYGGKPKKKKDRIQDLIDIGYGYDEEDSFIDNSEAYDEFVPASLTTKFGGFYVNSGVLQFRQASDTEDLTTEEKTLEPSKKRKLNGAQDKPKKKPCKEGGEMKSNEDPKSSTLSEIAPDDEMMKKKKKKKAGGTLSVTSMLKKFQREKEKERQKVMKENQKIPAIMGATTIPLCPADAAGGGGSGLTDPLLSLIGSTNDHALIQAANTVDFDIDLDSLLDVSEGTSSPKLVPQLATETQFFQPKTDDQTLAQLPNAAKFSEGESKLKFFTPEINSILLDIELQCREQGGQLRSKVYTHLSSFLPCSRDTLLKRFYVQHDPMHKLKEAIGKAMPEQIACFHENCKLYEQVKTSKAMEEEKEGKQKMNVEDVEEKGGKKGGPKKLFKWNEEIRGCLCHVLRVKMEKYKKERKGSEAMEEYLKTLLDNEVKPLWPKGWMQSRYVTLVHIHTFSHKITIFIFLYQIFICRHALFQHVSGPEKKQKPSINGPASDNCSILQPSPDEDEDCVFIAASNISNSMSLGAVKKEVAVLKKVEGKAAAAAVIAAAGARAGAGAGVAVDGGFSTPAESDEPLVNATSTPTHTLLDLLADQALAREQPLSVSQELLAAAVAKYKHSVQHWSFGADTKSPPLPPPPPQSSPVGFPVSGVCQVVLPQLLQIGDFARHMDAGKVQIISDDADITIQ